MQSLLLKDFHSLIQDEKVVVMFHKDHCSNCEKMLPRLQEFSEGRPDIKVYEILVDQKNEELVKFFRQKIQRKFHRDAQFPFVMTFSKGSVINGMVSVFNTELLTHAFQETWLLATTIGEMQIAYDEIEEQHKKVIAELKREESVIKAIIKRKRVLEDGTMPDEWSMDENAQSEDDWQLPEQTIDEKDKVPCEKCQ